MSTHAFLKVTTFSCELFFPHLCVIGIGKNPYFQVTVNVNKTQKIFVLC